jgi:glucoamylase
MPLLWSHAEFLKLLVARERGRPIELLKVVEQRYLGAQPPLAPVAHWRAEAQLHQLARGSALEVEDRAPFRLHCGLDGWHQVRDIEATQGPFGIWSVRLGAAELAGAAEFNFTRCYAGGWEGVDHRLRIDGPGTSLTRASAA